MKPIQLISIDSNKSKEPSMQSLMLIKRLSIGSLRPIKKSTSQSSPQSENTERGKAISSIECSSIKIMDSKLDPLSMRAPKVFGSGPNSFKVQTIRPFNTWSWTLRAQVLWRGKGSTKIQTFSLSLCSSPLTLFTTVKAAQIKKPSRA